MNNFNLIFVIAISNFAGLDNFEECYLIE